ncbi:hypothetical protein LRP67_18725 [Nocardioides sp. cx-169]|uniref:hypothetical protein n=1 Tax=Nocardioides sp. cx-169 TaxID=2899080 RepID=UPI001E5D468B|nr:hypothetical protein [Nocardioides sp. cx-169]MCD4536129.1 hypothetical protein [Nocardioides sp. cx-169]
MTSRANKVRAALLTGLTTSALLASSLGATADATGAGHDHARATASGTITYVRANNVWVANTDGSGARQVTSGGTASTPWYSPTESDAGQIVAGRGDLIYRMDQWGKVLTTMDPPDLRSGGGQTLGGRLSSLAVSPDGATIAYTYSKNYCSTINVCKIWPVTGFTSSTKLSTPDDYGTSYGQTPSWVTNTRVALDARTGFDNLYLYEVGRGTVGYYWFDDANIHTDDLDLFDLEVSLGSPYGVAVRGSYDQARITFYDLSGTGDFRTGVPSPPDWQMGETNPESGLGSPTISADGKLAAWHEAAGISTFGMEPGLQPVLIIPGGSSPSLSRAALQTTRPTYPPAPFVTKAAPQVKGTAKLGKKLRAAAPVLQPRPTSLRYQWYRDGKAIKGAKRATYEITKRDRGHKLKVRVVAIRKGYTTKALTSKAVRVRK